MAKAKDLAGLAALGALGYMLNKKSYKEDAGDQKTSSYTGDTKKVEAKDVNYGNEGRRTSMGVAPAPKTTTKAAPKLETITTRKDPREAEAGMSRGTRTTPKDPREAEAGMSRGTRTTSMAGAGRGFVNPPAPKPTDPRSAESGMSRGTRTTSMAGAGRGSVNPPMPKPADPRSTEAGMSRGTRATTPPFKGGQPGYDEAGNFMGGQRGFDEAGNPMKKGGMVKKMVNKMASGGMTASRRGDGIATRGKTKCKMY
jgi:hypothetical protein